MCPDINRHSLQRDFKVMEDCGLVVTEGETHHLLYRLASLVNLCDTLNRTREGNERVFLRK